MQQNYQHMRSMFRDLTSKMNNWLISPVLSPCSPPDRFRSHSPLLCLLLLEFHFGEEGDADLASESEKDNACAAKKFPCFQCIMNGWLC